MMSVNERFYLNHPPQWWVFGVLSGTVPLIAVAISLANGQVIDWDATTPLLIVCFEVIAISILSARRRHRETGSPFWEARAQGPPDDNA